MRRRSIQLKKYPAARSKGVALVLLAVSFSSSEKMILSGGNAIDFSRKRLVFCVQITPSSSSSVFFDSPGLTGEDEISFSPLKIGKEVNDVFFLARRRIRTTGDEYRRRHRRQKKEKKKRLLPRLSAASSSSSHLWVVSLLTEFSPFVRTIYVCTST